MKRVGCGEAKKKRGEYSLEFDTHLEEVTVACVVACERSAQRKEDGQASDELTLFPSSYLDTAQSGLS